MSESNHDDLVDTIFDQFKDKKLYMDALDRAAEEAYQSEMVDTNMAVHEIAEVAGAYKYYENDEEREHAIRNCSYETKEQWLADKINSWLDPKASW